jgi:quercetin dioxygenase-like cupin family protein
MRAFLLLAAGMVAGACGPLLAQTASAPTELFRAALPDMPGKQLVVVSLHFRPGNSPKAPAHQHPGSVFVYVTQGEARLGVEGQVPQVVPAGKGFFEPVGAIHNVSESASPTEPADGIAVMIVPDGAPLVSPAPASGAGR